MGSIEEYIHYANLTLFMRQLADPSITDEKRRMLTRLLAQEEGKHFGERALRRKWSSIAATLNPEVDKSALSHARTVLAGCDDD